MTTATATRQPLSFEEFCDECITRSVDSPLSYFDYQNYLHRHFDSVEDVELFNNGFNPFKNGVSTPIQGTEGFIVRTLIDYDSLLELLDEEQLATVEAYDEAIFNRDFMGGPQVEERDYLVEFLGEDTVKEDTLAQLLWAANDWLEANDLDPDELSLTATFEALQHTDYYSTFAVRLNLA